MDKSLSFLQCQHTLAAAPSEGSNTPHIKHWCCLYSQFLHKKIFIAYKNRKNISILKIITRNWSPYHHSEVQQIPQLVPHCIQVYRNKSLRHFLFLHGRSAYMGHHSYRWKMKQVDQRNKNIRNLMINR